VTVWKFGGFDLNVQVGSEEEQLVDGIKNQIQRDEQFEEGLKCSLADKEVYEIWSALSLESAILKLQSMGRVIVSSTDYEQKYDKTRQVA